MSSDIDPAAAGGPPAAKMATQALARGAPQQPPGRTARTPAVAGTIGKDRALESVDKYAMQIGRPDLVQHNVKILFPDLV
jgi:hypothetical protein